MPRCFIAFGGNLGRVEETFAAARARLGETEGVRLIRGSSLFRSSPVGEHSGGEFLNAAAEIETELEPLQLLDRLQAIESDLGRTREVHWGPRTLDLDLILYGSEVLELPRLRVPHPACWYRRFVLDPLVEIAADVVHPEKRISFGRLRERLLERPLRLGVTGADRDARSAAIGALERQFAAAAVSPWRSGDPGPALLAWLGPGRDAPDFASLPVVPRLDASAGEPDRIGFLRGVLQAAFDDCRRVG